MGANRKLPTMTDVARLAGVSQSTVSLVLRGKAGDNIPEATRDRIFQASSELGEQAGQCVKQYRQRNHRHADR